MPKARISLLNALGGGPLVITTQEKKRGKVIKKTVTISDAGDSEKEELIKKKEDKPKPNTKEKRDDKKPDEKKDEKFEEEKEDDKKGGKGGPKEFTKEQDQKILSMTKANKPMKDICAAVKASPKDIEARVAELEGAEKEKKDDESKGKSFTEDQDKKILDMKKAGESWRNIAQAVNSDKNSVRDRFKELEKAEQSSKPKEGQDNEGFEEFGNLFTEDNDNMNQGKKKDKNGGGKKSKHGKQNVENNAPCGNCNDDCPDRFNCSNCQKDNFFNNNDNFNFNQNSHGRNSPNLGDGGGHDFSNMYGQENYSPLNDGYQNWGGPSNQHQKQNNSNEKWGNYEPPTWGDASAAQSTQNHGNGNHNSGPGWDNSGDNSFQHQNNHHQNSNSEWGGDGHHASRGHNNPQRGWNGNQQHNNGYRNSPRQQQSKPWENQGHHNSPGPAWEQQNHNKGNNFHNGPPNNWQHQNHFTNSPRQNGPPPNRHPQTNFQNSPRHNGPPPPWNQQPQNHSNSHNGPPYQNQHQNMPGAYPPSPYQNHQNHHKQNQEERHLRPNNIYSPQDCALLESLEKQHREDKWLHVQAGFRNITGREIASWVIEGKFREDGLC